MLTKLAALINKQDTFEIVREQLGGILKLESVNQTTIAKATNGIDPTPYDFRVFEERSNPWEEFREGEYRPIVNVWWDGETFDPSASNVMDRQKATSTYNIDIYAAGLAESDPNGGQFISDVQAAKECQRTVRLVRNILRSNLNCYLQLRGIVWKQWIQSITPFQPEFDGQSVERMQAARIVTTVDFNETSPEVAPVDLELLSVIVNRAETGELLVEAEYDYT